MSLIVLAGLFLALLSIQHLYIAFGNVTLPALLNGPGQTGFFMRLALLTGLIGFPLGFALIMVFGVMSLVFTTAVAPVPSLVMGLFFVKRRYGLTVDLFSSLRILVSSGVAGVVTFLVVSELGVAAWIRLLLGVVLFVVVLVPALLFSRAVTRADIANLKLMLEGLGAIGGVITKVLSLLE